MHWQKHGSVCCEVPSSHAVCRDAEYLGILVLCRAVRKADNARDEQRKQLGLPDAVKLLPLAPEDSAAAARIKFDKSGSFERNWKRHRQAIQAQPIFAAAAPQKQMTAQAAELARAVARGTAAKRKKSVSELAAQAAKRQRL